MADGQTNPVGTQPPPQQGQSESWETLFQDFRNQVKSNNPKAIEFQKKIFADNPSGLNKRKFAAELTKVPGLVPPGMTVTGLDDLIQKAGGPAPQQPQAPGMLDNALGYVENKLPLVKSLMGGGQQPAPAQPKPAPKPQAKPAAPGDQAFNTEGKQVNVPQHVPSQKAPTKAWRYKNPGNLHFANQPGATLADDGVSAQFDTIEHGYAAIQNQIYVDSQGGMTLGDFISKYAPPNENDTEGYIARVTKELGFDSPNVPLGSVNPSKLQDIVAQVESGTTVSQPEETPKATKPEAPTEQPKKSKQPEAPKQPNSFMEAYGQVTKDNPVLHPFTSVLEPLRDYAGKLGQLGKGHGPAAEAAAGFAQGTADFGIDMTSLANVGITAGAMLLGGDEFKAATSGLKGAAKIIKWAPQIAHGVFSAQMWNDIAQTAGGDKAKEAYEKEDYQLAGQLLARVVADSFFIYKGNEARKAKGERTLTGEAVHTAKETVKGAFSTKTAPPPEAKPTETPKAEAKPAAEPAKPDFDTFRRKNFILKNGKLFQRGEEHKGAPGYTEAEVRKHFETGEELPPVADQAPKKTPGVSKGFAEKVEAIKATAKPKPIEKVGPQLPEEHAGEDLTHTRGRGEKATEHPLRFQSDIDKVAYLISKGQATPEQVKWAKEASGLTEKQLDRRGSNDIRVSKIAPQSAKSKPGDVITVPKTLMTAEELTAKNEADRKATAEAETKRKAAKPKSAAKVAKPTGPKIDFKDSGLTATSRRFVEKIVASGEKDPKKLAATIRDGAADLNLDNDETVKIAKFMKDKGLIGKSETKTTEPPKPPKEDHAAEIRKALDKARADTHETPENVKAAQDRIRARLAKLKSERGSVSNKPVSEEDRAMLNDLYTIGKHYVSQGAKDFGKWSKQMVDDFGDSIKQHLKPVWDKIQERSGNARTIKPATSEKSEGLTSDAGFQKLSPGARQMVREVDLAGGDAQKIAAIKAKFDKSDKATGRNVVSEAREYVRYLGSKAPKESPKTAEPPTRTKANESERKRTEPNKPESAEPNDAYDPKQARQPIPDRTPRMHRELLKRVPDIDAFYKKTIDSELFKQQPKNVQAMHRRMAQLAGDEKTFDTTIATRKDPIRNAYRKYLDKAIAKQPKPLSKIQADSLKVLAQADPDRAVNALMSRKGYTRDEAETLIRPYTDKQITKTAEPPAPPKEEAKPGLPKANNEGLDHTTALKAAEVVQGRFAKATSDLRHYPLEFKVLDAEGKELHTQTVKDPREMDSIRPTLAALVLEPGAASIEYKAGNSKGTIPVATAVKESASLRDIKPKAAKTAAPPTREAAEPDDPFGPAGSMAGETEEPAPREPEQPKKNVKLKDLALPNHGSIIQEVGGGGKYQYLGTDQRGMIRIRPVTGGETEFVLPSEWDQFKVVKPAEHKSELGNKLEDSLKKKNEVTAAGDRLKAAIKRGERGSFSHRPLDAHEYSIGEKFKDIYTVGRDAFERTGVGAKNLQKWVGEMVSKYGEDVKPYLQAVWDLVTKPQGPVWYSQAERAIESKMPNAASAEQVKAILTNSASGVKADEMKWTGLDDLLAKGGKLTKKQVLDHLQQNAIQVNEITNDDKQTYKSGDRNVSTKYAGYQTPGGSNYKELLLTLPTDQSPVPMEDLSGYLSGEKQNIGKPSYQSPHWDEPNVLAHIRMNDRTDADGKKMLFMEEMQSDWHQKGRKEGYKPSDYTRIDREMRDKENKLEEEKSDLVIKAHDEYNKQRSFGNSMDVYHPEKYLQPKDQERWEEIKKQLNDFSKQRYRLYHAPPDAPFSKSWHELSFKRMLRHAAEHGYDRLGWTTGEQQAERYDLSKQIKTLQLYPDAKGRAGTGDKFMLEAYDHKDNSVISKSVTADQLPDIIGKEMAQKLLDKEPRNSTYHGEIRELSGLDLKIGGEGMKGFYDKILPDFANKYAKKWGARVGEAGIETSSKGRLGAYKGPDISAKEMGDIQEKVLSDISQVRGKLRPGQEADEGAGAYILNNMVLHSWPLSHALANAAEADAREWNGSQMWWDQAIDRIAKAAGGSMNLKDKSKVHSIDITPEMKKSVLFEGQPISKSLTPKGLPFKTQAPPELDGFIGA